MKKGLTQEIVKQIVDSTAGIELKVKAAWSAYCGPAGEDGPRVLVPKQETAVGRIDVSSCSLEDAKAAAGDAADAVIASPVQNGRVLARIDVEHPRAADALKGLLAAVGAGTVPTLGKKSRREGGEAKPANRLIIEVKPPAVEPEPESTASGDALTRLEAVRAKIESRRADEEAHRLELEALASDDEELPPGATS
jgi:hypothetical protein